MPAARAQGQCGPNCLSSAGRQDKGYGCGAGVRATLNELKRLNRILERDDAYEAIVARKREVADHSPTLECCTLRRWRTPESLLLPIAQAIAKFVTSQDISRVKSCEKSPCTLFFVDRTRGRARRWCSMALCGNLAKQALYRSRLKRRKGSATRARKTKP